MALLSDIDRTQLKNSTLDRTDQNNGTMGFHENIKVIDNYRLIKITNYSSVGYVFGLAQFGTTRITSSASPTTTIHSLDWDKSVKYLGDNGDLIVDSNNITLSHNYKDLQFTSTNTNSYFKHALMYNVMNNTSIALKTTILAQTTTTEKYNYYFEGIGQNSFTSSRHLLHDENEFILLSKVPLSQLFVYFERDDDNSTTNDTQHLNQIQLSKQDEMVFSSKLSNSYSIDYATSTGTFNNGWSGNTGDQIVSKLVCLSPDKPLKSFTLDMSEIDTNIDFITGGDKFYYSEEGINWIEAIMLSNKKIFPTTQEKGFPYTFPLPFINKFKSFYFKIVVGSDNKYIDTSKGNFKIYFEIE